MKRLILWTIVLLTASVATAEIIGPTSVPLGTQATYTESQPTATEYGWSVSPDGSLIPNGASATFAPKTAGEFTLGCSGTTNHRYGLFKRRVRTVTWNDTLSVKVTAPLGKWSVSYPASTQTIKAVTADDAIAASVPPAPDVKPIAVPPQQVRARGPPPKFARGLKPTPPGVLKAAIRAGEPLMAKLRALPQPPENYDGSGGVRDFTMFGNDIYGNCVTAEEAAAKRVISAKTGAPTVRIPDANVIDYCRKYGGLNGEYLDAVLTKMTKYGLVDDKGIEHKDDPTAVALDGSKKLIVQLAIYYTGQIKVGVAANQIQNAMSNSYGWVLLNARPDSAEDHCVGYCGYGSLEFCCKTLGVAVPRGADPKRFCLIMFTWATLGIVDWDSVQNITSEWWMRGTDPDRLDAAAWAVTYQKAMADITGGNVIPPNATTWRVEFLAQAAVEVMATDAADAAKRVPYKGKATATKVEAVKTKIHIIDRPMKTGGVAIAY